MFTGVINYIISVINYILPLFRAYGTGNNKGMRDTVVNSQSVL